MERSNRILLKARRPVSTGGYTVRNERTGCIGAISKKMAGTPPELTVTHTIGCGCLDVRLSALCRHANYMVKLGRLQRSRKYDLVLALKLRSCPSLPPKLQLRVSQQKQTGDEDSGDNDSNEKGGALRVIEYRGVQTLTERWDSLEAYRKRKIWQDW